MPADVAFMDSNILIYALGDEQEVGDKKSISITLLCQNMLISTQTLNECSNVLRRKFNWAYQEIQETLVFILHITQCIEVTRHTVRQAWFLGDKYRYSYFDSLVLASALEGGCHILYSEDMQHGQLIENQLRIINPFLPRTPNL